MAELWAIRITLQPTLAAVDGSTRTLTGTEAEIRALVDQWMQERLRPFDVYYEAVPVVAAGPDNVGDERYLIVPDG